MADMQIESSVQTLIEAAVLITANALKQIVEENGQAVWCLAGGRVQMEAYKLIAKRCADQFDWEKIKLILGDERCVALHAHDSNWQQISEDLLDKLSIPDGNKLRPQYELIAEQAATKYDELLKTLPKNEKDIPRLDYLWLGMGEDGHTLSLFPGNDSLAVQNSLAAPVHNAPKPPPDRISLTLKALHNVNECLVIAAGADKAEAIVRAHKGDESLPIVSAIKAIEGNNGHVMWLIDESAASKL